MRNKQYSTALAIKNVVIKKNSLFLSLYILISFSVFGQNESTVVYIEQYKKIATEEMKRTGIPASITLAQGILESNSGQSDLAKKANNHFGIKCKSDWKGEKFFQDDDTKQECFRVYPNVLASFKDHSDFLKNRPNYAPLFQLDPVDDSAWAIGLKKAGYATAPDYAKKIMKIIDDYELSQYNFPELEDEEEVTSIPTPSAPNVNKVNVEKTIEPTHVKDTIATPTKDSVVTKINNNAVNNTTKPIESKLAQTTVMDTLPTKVSKKQTINYPNGRFRINQVPVIWAKAGTSFLAIANDHHIPLYKLFSFNEMEEMDIVNEDQLIYLSLKKKTGNKTLHIVKLGESLKSISQTEGIQLKYLQEYNSKMNTTVLKEGAIIMLVKPK